jgi:D-alanyl-D-alanine carboxypeptidase (penicillin-binding protein 5/6)
LAEGISADAAIVYNAVTGNAVFEKNADRREFPASMTKMMTGILAIESGKLNQEIAISKAASDASYTFLKTGDKLIMSELLYMLMLSSNNGAAVALAEYLSTPRENFTAKMNKKAKTLGMHDTHFVTPNGMHHNDHYSTARDMAILGAYCMRNPQFKVYVNTQQHRARWKKPAGKHYACYNENKLLSLYDGVNGIKTGYTEPAMCCLATSYEKNGKRLIVVVMHSKKGQFKYHDTKKLLDWALRRV